MARLNTGAKSLSITGTFTLTYAFTGGLITLSGTAPYVVTLANPVFFPGSKQEFYNSTNGDITLTTSTNNIAGPGFTSASSQTIPAGATYTLISNGTNYIVTNEQGGPLAATTGTFTTSATIPTIQGSTANSGQLTIRATSSATKPTAGILMTDGISSNATTTGTLVVTGGVGVSENIRAGGTIYGTLNSSSATLSGGSIDNMAVGGTTRAAGAFTTLAANNTATFTGQISAATTTNNQSYTTTGSGTITISSGTTGSINNMTIGQTTAALGTFSTMTATTATLTNGTISTAPSSGNDIANKTYVDNATKKITGFGFYYGNM